MLVLLKQIFRTFKKNFLLIGGLFIVICTIFLISSSSIQLTLSINNSIQKINSEGKLANVVSNDIPSIGKISYQYDENTVPFDRTIITSSLEPQKDIATNTYRMEDNTLFPYIQSDFDFITADGSTQKIKDNIKKNPGKKLLSGIQINENETDLSKKYIFPTGITNPNNPTNYPNGYPI